MMLRVPTDSDFAKSGGMLQFDSEGLPVADRFSRYWALYADGTDAEQTGPDFLAQVRAWPPDRVTIMERRLNDVGHHRGHDRAGIDRFDHLVITLLVSGTLEVDVGSGFVRVPVGAGLIADTRYPLRNRMRHAHLFTLRVARDQFVSTIGSPDGLHGVILPPTRAVLLADYVAMLRRRMDELDAAATGVAVDALFMLMAGAIGPMTGVVESPATVRDMARLARIRALIDTAIADPDLGPDMIVANADLSRATLYRLFKPFGGFTAYIQARRLQLLMLALNDETETRSFGDLALAMGFRSEGHASRLFQQRYGVRPGRYRIAWTEQANPDVPLREMHFLNDNIY